jgi:hypothetical protein
MVYQRAADRSVPLWLALFSKLEPAWSRRNLSRSEVGALAGLQVSEGVLLHNAGFKPFVGCFVWARGLRRAAWEASAPVVLREWDLLMVMTLALRAQLRSSLSQQADRPV